MGRRERQFFNVIILLAVVLVGVFVAKLVEKQRIILHLQSSLAEKERIITQLQRYLPASSYTCHVSGPGLSATANYPTHVIVELSDPSGQPCSLRQNVTAELQSVDQSSIVPTTVSTRSPSQYEVLYTALSRGQHKLRIRLNGSEVSGSPFNITVYSHPTQLGTPVRVVSVWNHPYFIAINSHGEMVVSFIENHEVSLLDSRGKKIRTYGSKGKGRNQMYPRGVAVDSDDNVYVASANKMQKFSRDGHLIKCVDRSIHPNNPMGIALHNGQIYVCDRGFDNIGVFDTDLNFIQNFGSWRQFHMPHDLDLDAEGKTYLSNGNYCQIQVINTHGEYVRHFGEEEELKILGIHVIQDFVYVSDGGHDRIAVYQTSGEFVTSFGTHGKAEGELRGPYGINSDQNGFVYVADYSNSRIQVF